jgi:hypothetical protein
MGETTHSDLLRELLGDLPLPNSPLWWWVTLFGVIWVAELSVLHICSRRILRGTDRGHLSGEPQDRDRVW